MSNTNLTSIERIEKAIYLIRGEKVMLDRDLAKLYGVLTGALNQAVRRNRERFPEDFMFQLTSAEVAKLNLSQIVIGSEKVHIVIWAISLFANKKVNQLKVDRFLAGESFRQLDHDASSRDSRHDT